MNSQAGPRLIVLTLVAVSIALLFHELPDQWPLLRRLAQYLFFLPIVMAGLWFGWRGGLAAAVACTLLYLPRLLLLVWKPTAAAYGLDDVAEAVDLLLVGSVFGVLADRERRKTHALEETSAKLRDTYSELESSLEHLKRAERLSGVGQLTANLAHEIRNPLASIEGAAGLLENPDALPAEQRTEFVRIIKTESRRLNRLLTDMLDYAKQRSPQFRPTEIEPILTSVVNLISSTAARNQVAIKLEAAPNLPRADCDASQVQQVIMNLLLNAIQSMPGGGQIAVACSTQGPRLAIVVRDEGPGIAPDDADKIFSAFYTTKASGTGLGLAVAQQIAVSHGGEITVSANQPRGAVFTFAFPVRHKAPLSTTP